MEQKKNFNYFYGKEFEIEKGRFSFRLTAPYSEERRQKASENAKQNGFSRLME